MCKVEWCSSKPHPSGKGYCRRHYDQMRVHGKILDSRTCRNPNDLLIHKSYAEIVIRNAKGHEVARGKIDIEDVDTVRKHKWSLHNNGYVRCLTNGKTTYLHRVLMKAQPGEEIDHINLDKLDNRKANLRKCEHAQNCWNRRSSKHGVRRANRNLAKPYYAMITVKGKAKFLGYFCSEDEALQARLRAEAEHHGEFKCSAG